MTTAPPSLALQLAVRVEKGTPPRVADICRATATATIALLDDPRSRPGGPWHPAVDAWNGDRTRKLVRRARGAAWERVQSADGLTVAVDGVEVRAFVPGPVDAPHPAVAKLQIQTPPLGEPDHVSELPPFPGLTVAVNPGVSMSWGKQAAQCAHAAQRAWLTAEASTRADWHRAGRPLRVVHPGSSLWEAVTSTATTTIHDGGFTEIPAGTLTSVAWWHSPFVEGGPMTRQEIRLGGPNEARIGLSRAVRVGDHISVGGTAAINDDGSNVPVDDVAAQARLIWTIISDALDAAGASVRDIVRTRTMLVDAADFEIVSRIRRDVLDGVMPVDTIVEVSGFIDPDWRLEIEVDAIVSGP